MRCMFILIGCPVCNYAEMAVNMVNCNLEIGRKIEYIDVLKNDPRCAILEEIYGTDDPYEWEVPVLIIDDVGVQRVFDNYFEGKVYKGIIKSSSNTRHYYYLLRNYFKPM